MRIKQTFRCYRFIFILILVLPITIQAQQNTDLDIINAKADAIRDAKADVNPFAWFTAGCLLSYTSVVLAGRAYSEGSITSEMQIPAALCVSTLGIATLYYSARPDPPTNRFIGKTPQYVETYIATYKQKSRNRQTLLAAAGVANGCLILSASTVGLAYGLTA
ncbi:hypothetical protein F4054_00020 [Candidatus Poribacteria bacterium]|nr:hypothetical protein [Candidatus Poribacteria bacterium]MYG05290.1 hypothetical protein [Candidatus Poribacteria bacterium]MYK20631.1 hypothetical protein [Candidatus Poribacteria bacterium]